MAHKPSYEDLEQQVKESDNKYQNLLNTSLVGIYQTSITGDILYVNEALATIFGFESPEEMLLESSIVRYKYAEDRGTAPGGSCTTRRAWRPSPPCRPAPPAPSDGARTPGSPREDQAPGVRPGPARRSRGGRSPGH